MFVDASALVAIIAREEGWETLAKRAELAKDRLTSPIAIYEASQAIARKGGVSAGDGCAEVMSFLDAARIRAVDITAQDGVDALEAFLRYGKGRHRAALNMGDCFAYACAKAAKVPLLFKGDDFVHTDIEAA